jgi:hypothetical protein
MSLTKYPAEHETKYCAKGRRFRTCNGVKKPHGEIIACCAAHAFEATRVISMATIYPCTFCSDDPEQADTPAQAGVPTVDFAGISLLTLPAGLRRNDRPGCLSNLF